MEEEYTIPFGKNNYCGPCALAYVLRTDPDSAAALLREVSGKRAIRGTYNHHMISAMARRGILVTKLPFRIVAKMHYGRLVTWAAEQNSGDEYLVNVTGHYLILHRGIVYDSHKHLGVPIEKSKWARTYVRGAWRIEREVAYGQAGEA